MSTTDTEPRRQNVETEEPETVEVDVDVEVDVPLEGPEHDEPTTDDEEGAPA
jgi:hypothetical protein